jgi:hypothetical protein
MTTVAGSPPGVPASLDAADSLARCLASADELAEAASALGLATDALRGIGSDARRRLGFPGDAWVLALVGGTGVGKSSLLNALAGTDVSHASVLRPTTARPVAWVPASERAALQPLLAWLGVEDVREHPAGELGPVAILDLPDMDSVAGEHRARVEAILPRVDAVAWVADPEKYHDAVLHDAFLRTWLPRLARQVMVINKADRVRRDDARRIRADLEADVAAWKPQAGVRVPILFTSATRDGETDELRAWIAAAAEAKAIVRARVAASLVAEARDVAAAAGLDPGSRPEALLGPDRRRETIRRASDALLRTIDMPGLEAQAVAATRAAARARGTGPIGRVTSLLYRASGRETRAADPRGYLRRWRDRGSTTPAVEAVRGALAEPVRAATPAVRPALLAAMEPAALRRGLEHAVDRAIAATGDLEPPRSAWWRLLGVLQVLSTAGIVLAAAWVVVWVLVRPETGSVVLPLLGPVPAPFAWLVAFLALGFVLARLLGAHAGWVGRRWAAGVRGAIARAVEAELADGALEPLDAFEAARRRVWELAASISRDCASG